MEFTLQLLDLVLHVDRYLNAMAAQYGVWTYFILFMVFPEMCHACGGCRAVCPVGAVGPGEREIGRVEEGTVGENVFLRGLLRVGEAMEARSTLSRMSSGSQVAKSSRMVTCARPPPCRTGCISTVSRGLPGKCKAGQRACPLCPGRKANASVTAEVV